MFVTPNVTNKKKEYLNKYKWKYNLQTNSNQKCFVTECIKRRRNEKLKFWQIPVLFQYNWPDYTKSNPWLHWWSQVGEHLFKIRDT